MRVSWIIWLMVLSWIFNYAAFLISVAVILFLKRKIFTLVLTAGEVTLATAVAAAYGCWLLINFGSGVQTWRSFRPTVAIVFLLQMYISLAIELFIFILFSRKRDKFIKSVLALTVGQLLHKYTASDDAVLFSDWINETFECCGLTQWHYEWWMDERGWTLPNLNTSYAWVPQSCCIRTAYYKNCGLARPRMKPKTWDRSKSDGDASGHVEEVKALFELDSSAATDWYGRLNNEPCPEMILEYVERNSRMPERVCQLPHELPTNRVFQPTEYTSPEGLTNGILEVRPLKRCNSAKTIRSLLENEADQTGFYHFRPLNDEKYHYTLPKDKDGLGKWVTKSHKLQSFKRPSLDDIDVVIRCQLQRRRHFIRRLFVEADCQKKGNVTKAALLQIFHVLCPEMKVDQFHRLCERYCLDETPILSFNEFEAIFGVPPVGETRAPEPRRVFGYDHMLSVAFAFETILRGASSKGFALKELLPPSCFDINGRVLKPQMREMLARMRVNLTDENFRRLWAEKFDLEGIGSIATRQLIDQLGLTEEGIPKKETIKLAEYKFPASHRAEYKNFSGHNPLLKVNPCPLVAMDPVSQPLQSNEKSEAVKLPESCKSEDAQPAMEECIPSVDFHYKDQISLLRKRRPCFRNPIEQLQYIFDEPRMALGLVFQNADSEGHGYISIMLLLAIFRDIGLKVDLEDVERYAKRQGLFVDSDKDLCASNGKSIAYKQLLRQLECAPPPRTSDKVKRGDSCPLKKGSRKVRYLEDELFRTLFHDYFDFIERLEKLNKDGGVPLEKFRDLVEATVGFTMHQCQWEDLVRRIRLKQDCRVDLNHFLSYISKECNNSPYRASKAGNIVHDPELKSLVQFSGEPRELSHLLLVIQRLIAEKFAIIDKIYKHFDHVGHATIDKHDFGVIMKKVGLEMCEVELDAVWRLVNEAEPSANGLHKYRQVMRFFLETRNIRYHLATAKRNKRLHDPNLLKLRGFRQCQKDFKKQHIDDTLALGKAALEIKYMGRQKTKPSEERVDELCKKIRTFVIAIWTDLRNGFLWQDPFGWGSMLRKDFKKVCEAFSFPLDTNELDELAHGLDKHDNGHVNYVEFLSRFSEGHIPPKVGQKFDIVHHKLKNLKDGSEIGVKEAMDKIRQICLREYKTLLTGFRAIASPKHPDFFNEKDLGDFLRKHGMDFSADCLYHLRTAYDQHRRGCINYADFLQQTMDVTRPLE